MEDNKIKEREVVKKVFVKKECTWFVQALLEDTGLVSLSLGSGEEITIFYDKKVEKEVINFFKDAEQFCDFEFYQERL